MTTNLLDAVLDWLVYLGVATDVKTYDKGKIEKIAFNIDESSVDKEIDATLKLCKQAFGSTS